MGIAMVLLACGDGGMDPPRPTSVRVQSTFSVFTSIGQTSDLTATVLDQSGNPLGGQGAPTWNSDAPGIVDVTTDGVATARAPGSARISASIDGISGSVELSVVVARVSGTITALGRNLRFPFPASVGLGPPVPAASPQRHIRSDLIVIYRQEATPAVVRGAHMADRDAAIRTRDALEDRTARTLRGEEQAPSGALVSGVALDAVVRGVSPVIRAVRVAVVDGADTERVRRRLEADPLVSSVFEDGIAEGHGEPVYPSDPFHRFQAWNHGVIDLPYAWSTTTGSASVLVSVLDDGIRFDHPDIAPNLTSDGYDFVSAAPIDVCAGGVTDLGGDGDGYDPDPTIPRVETWNPVDGCISGTSAIGGHGLHTTGIVGSVANNGVGGAGVAWGVRIRPVRVLGTTNRGFFYDIAQGVLYAAGLPADDGAGGVVQTTEPARVISMSLGGSGINDALRLATEAATQAGTLLIASAGNNNNSALQYPAGFPDVMTVSAIGPSLDRATYSSFGSHVDIAAPGGQSSTGFSHAVFSLGWNFVANAPVVSRRLQGTSMAVPHVTGVAALVLSVEPNLTPAQLRDRLNSTAVDLGAAGRDDFFGHGLVNARLALTAGAEPGTMLHARLYDAQTGSIVETRPVDPGGTYEFLGMPAGDYFLFAGSDDGDGVLGRVRHRWGALGGVTAPTPVTVGAGATVDVSFSATTPFESESNDGMETADLLVSGGYLLGGIEGSDVDYFEFRVPAAGSYSFETTGWYGSCGFAGEVDTFLEVLDPSGGVIASNDDADAASDDRCSVVTTTLNPGVYYLRVSEAPPKPATGDPAGGRYAIRSFDP